LSNKLYGLYAVTDDSLLNSTNKLLTFSEEALKAGTSIIQYRAKHTANELRFEQATLLLKLCKKYNVPLIINDDVALAYDLGCGVHLGKQDGSIKEARKLLGKSVIIGSTCHNRLELALKAKQEGASYLAFGRFFPSYTKPDAPHADLAILQEAKQYQLPIVAIGGININNALQVITSGADMIAISHELFARNNSQEVFLHTTQLNNLFKLKN